MGIVVGAMKNLAIVAAEEGLREVPDMEYAVIADSRVVDVWESLDEARRDAEKIAEQRPSSTVVEIVPFIQFGSIMVSGPEDYASGII